MSNIQIGDHVIAHYKSGSYIAKVIEDRDPNYLVEVHAVEKHPMQGDLHNPGKTEGVFFHQRKALSHREKANVSKQAVKAFDGEVPAYEDSLQASIDKLKEKLKRRDSEFNDQALDQLESLEAQYFPNK
ncbi:kinase-associated lipoprotein B [Thalassobacillus hwangdonensis]|uniref:Kinase-associated lipoprotein B n=1 Tax=Thalassobacillus hwangdonensis TaxID=546108 RepID=A0ABW3L360_9BACI